MTGHSIEWVWDGTALGFKVRCVEPEGANCRVAGMCDCESWVIERDPDGRAFHMAPGYDEDREEETEVRHEMASTGYCGVAEHLEELDLYDLLEMADTTSSITLGATPFDPSWNGDYYEWAPVEPEAPADSVAALRSIQSLHVAVARPSMRGGTEHRCKACANSPHPCQTWTSLQRVIEP